jgi:hypothetical protein
MIIIGMVLFWLLVMRILIYCNEPNSDDENCLLVESGYIDEQDNVTEAGKEALWRLAMESHKSELVEELRSMPECKKQVKNH